MFVYLSYIIYSNDDNFLFFVFDHNRRKIYFVLYIYFIYWVTFFFYIFFFVNSWNHYFTLGCINTISGSISLIFFHFFWLEDTSASLWILACSIFTGIYFTSILTAIKKYLDNKVFISVMALDCGIFSLILYFIYKFLICLKDCCKTWDCECEWYSR